MRKRFSTTRIATLLLVALMLIVSKASPPAELLEAAYRPFGAALELMYDRSDEVLLSGPAGTGKSRACLEKLHILASKYPRSRLLILRKTRESLTESGLVTFEDKVLPSGSPTGRGPQRSRRQRYVYPKDAEIIVGGLDKASKIMSTEFDVIFVQEATELTDDDWEKLTSRLRNWQMPYQQLIADCNPASPQHWLKKRCERGDCRMYESRHEDNPTLYDPVSKSWTERGRKYIERLDRLTGVRKLRLRHGIWAMSEGMVYGDVWDPAIHLPYRSVICPAIKDGRGNAIGYGMPPQHWPRYWVVDFGFVHPFCWQAWAEGPEGVLYRYAEIYRTKTLVEDHARRILKWMQDNKEPVPQLIICDHDREDRATLERHLGLATVAAIKGPGSIEDSIQQVAARMRDRRLFLLRDSLLEVDPELVEAKMPTCTEDEIESYVWSTNAAGLKEVPVDRDNHGMDDLRYLVHYIDTQLSQGVF